VTADPAAAGSAGAAPTLDHVGFVGSDLRRLVAAMRRLGFSTTEPRELMRVDPATGERVSLHQQSCHAVFGTGYVELSAVLSDDPTHHLAAWRARGEGLHILALGSDVPDQDWRRCRAAGLPCTAPADASRRIEYGTRHGDARFRWFMLQPEASPEGLLCFARNLTPELVFQPEVSRHANGALALCEVVVQVESPQAVAARFGAITGLAPVAVRATAASAAAMAHGAAAAEAGLRFDLAGGAALTLLSPAAMVARFGAAAVAGLPAGRFAALQVRVARLAAAESLLRERGIACERRAAELVVPAAEACGAVLALRE
jgi:hypothetical protein